MKKSVFLSFFLIFSLSLPIALSVVQVIDNTFLSFESCQESQTEEQGAEEEERYNEVEGFIDDQFFISSLSFYDEIEDPEKNLAFKNIHREILTPPPKV